MAKPLKKVNEVISKTKSIISDLISLVRRSKNIKLVAIILIAAAIPLTVLVAQQQQEIRQRAHAPVVTAPAATDTPIPDTPVPTVEYTCENVTGQYCSRTGDCAGNDTTGQGTCPDYANKCCARNTSPTTTTVPIGGCRPWDSSRCAYPGQADCASWGDASQNDCGASDATWAACRTKCTATPTTTSAPITPPSVGGPSPASPTPSTVNCYICDLGQKRIHVRSSTTGCLTGESATDPGTCPTPTPIPTSVPPTATSIPPTATTVPTATLIPFRPEDVNRDSSIDTQDYEAWRYAYIHGGSPQFPNHRPNINGSTGSNDGVDLLDFNIWFVYIAANGVGPYR